MPKKKEPDLAPEEQFKRFQEAAKEHEIEERIPKIERALGKLAQPSRESKHSRQEKE